MDIMLDIETLATSQNAKMLSIGACGFYFNRLSSLEDLFKYKFYSNIEAYPLEFPFVESDKTKEWWSQQSDAAKQALEGNKRPIKSVLLDFCIWYTELTKTLGAGTVWANPPQFDCAILRNHFEYFKLDCPWHWTKERDYRTLREVIRQKNGFVPPDPVSVMTKDITTKIEKHNALHDAVCQAYKTQKIIQHLIRNR